MLPKGQGNQLSRALQEVLEMSQPCTKGLGNHPVGRRKKNVEISLLEISLLGVFLTVTLQDEHISIVMVAARLRPRAVPTLIRAYAGLNRALGARFELNLRCMSIFKNQPLTYI